MWLARISVPMWVFPTLAYLVVAAKAQTYLVCKIPHSHKCTMWRYTQDENSVDVSFGRTAKSYLYCGFTTINPRKLHRKIISIESISYHGLRKTLNCKRIEEAGELNNLQELEPLSGLPRTRRQAPYHPRGRYRGQTQSQYLSIDRGGKDEGKAEAQSAADTSKASVSGSSGMGQAQSQSIFDPSCDDCYGKAAQDDEILKRGPYNPAGITGGQNPNWVGGDQTPGVYNNGYPHKTSNSPSQNRRGPNQNGLSLSPDGQVVGNLQNPGIIYDGPGKVYGPTSDYSSNGFGPTGMGTNGQYGPENIQGNKGSKSINTPDTNTNNGQNIKNDINGFHPPGRGSNLPNSNIENGQDTGYVPQFNNGYQNGPTTGPGGYRTGGGGLALPNHVTPGYISGQPGNRYGQPIAEQSGYIPKSPASDAVYGPTNNGYDIPGQTQPHHGYEYPYSYQNPQQTKPTGEYDPNIRLTNGNYIPRQSNGDGEYNPLKSNGHNLGQITPDGYYNPIQNNRNNVFRPGEVDMSNGKVPNQDGSLPPGQLTVPSSGNNRPDSQTSGGSIDVSPGRTPYSSNGSPTSVHTNPNMNQNLPSPVHGSQPNWQTASGPYNGPGGTNYFCCVLPSGQNMPSSIYPNYYGQGNGPSSTNIQNVPNNLLATGTGSHEPRLGESQGSPYPSVGGGQHIPGTLYNDFPLPGQQNNPNTNVNPYTQIQQGPGEQSSYNIPNNGVNNRANPIGGGTRNYGPSQIDTLVQRGQPGRNNGNGNLAGTVSDIPYNSGNQGGPSGAVNNRYAPGTSEINYGTRYPTVNGHRGPYSVGLGDSGNQGNPYASVPVGQNYGPGSPVNQNGPGSVHTGNFNNPYGNVPNPNGISVPGPYTANSPGSSYLGSRSGVPGEQSMAGNGKIDTTRFNMDANVPTNFNAGQGTPNDNRGLNQQLPGYDAMGLNKRPNINNPSYPVNGVLGTADPQVNSPYGGQDVSKNMGPNGQFPYREYGTGLNPPIGTQAQEQFNPQKPISQGSMGTGPGSVSQNGYNEEPQNYIDPNLAIADGDGSQAEAVVSQAANGTTASASSKGGNEKERAQTHVQGTYTGSGSFQAQAQIAGDNKEAESEVSGSKKGASSSATGSGRNNKSQANVQLGSETGSVQTQSQSSGAMHSSNSQVQGSVKGGTADAQARGPGSTSSQAQIGFTPFKDGDKSHDLQKSPFVGGGMASAQSSGRTGQSQSQLHGTFKYGISYNGAAQSGASLDKDAVFANRLSFDKIDVFDEKEKNIDVDNTEAPQTTDISSSSEPIPLPDLPAVEDQTRTEKSTDERLSLDGTHPHSEHHKIETTQAPTEPAARRSFTNNNNNRADYEYSTDKDDNQPFEYDEGFMPDGSDGGESNTGDYPNYDEYPKETQTHQSLKTPDKAVKVRQITGGNTQHILLGSLKDQDAEITQRNSERPDEARVYQPGERIPGTGGYSIPIGFTGSVRSVASKDKTYVEGTQESPSQAQSVKLTPGSGKLKYKPQSYNRYVRPSDLRSLHGKDDGRYLSVSKSVTRSLDDQNNIRKQYSHTYYTKSSSCGYFTFTCTMVSSAEGKKKVCKPKIPTNPDGTPIKC
ncbi:probable cyclin-dependent serine/threonine-protein kinase DDB_G0292550 isoform X1 [Leptidea sinapis]|uniref:probable cyclin-dependent serine/threonine-protein kinase DDB_G0292550 isoform X1 n=1 Tax=Leptidea sinapis TaxID=189913 RepID=UPI002124C7C4|nr:probable cyclin-dependent serine/threonine-protein kinase DDB_G0292550 isoform X1 [Leptidea sinapis]